MGSAAKTLMMSNLKNTVWGFKKLIGRGFNDPLVQEEKKRVPYEIVQGPNGTTGIKVSFCALSSKDFPLLHSTRADSDKQG